uniref:DNA mismatch repair protein Mlh1 C-terminal domain-containing protein n=1 Tax=Arcella intermedia TaxID=1963864 RepID=A0A6B2L7V0_9EUKA
MNSEPTKKPNPKRPREDEDEEQGQVEKIVVVSKNKKAKMKLSDEEDLPIPPKKGNNTTKDKNSQKDTDNLTEEQDNPKKAKVKKESKASQSDLSQSTPSTQSSQRKPRKPISTAPKKRTKPQLTSTLNLLKQVEDVSQENLSKIFKNYSFVGCVSDGLALIQNQTELYLMDVLKLSKELFYQEALHNFAEFDSINLSSPAPIGTLCMIALDAPGSVWCPEDGPKESISNYVVELLVSRREMLQDYFSLTIDDEGQLLTLPQILPGYVPEIGALATFILRLSTEVDWEEEQTCFETLCREFAEFYSIAPDEENETKRYWTIEQILFPAFRRRFQVPSTAAEDGSIIRIASLDKLYKVFERC